MNTDYPLVSFGRAICGDLAAGLRREWLVTNGLGGYASGTLAGIATRRYHGLLVAALAPPVARTVLVGGLVEWATYAGTRFALSTNEYADGFVDQHGYRNLEAFALDGALPVWTFALGGALLEKRVWMAYGANTTYVSYRVLRATSPVRLEITPLVTYRDFHALSLGAGWQPHSEAQPGGMLIRAFDTAQPFRLLADGGICTPGGTWYWNFFHREEAARGLDAHADLYAPGTFAVTLAPDASWTLMLTSETELIPATTALAAAQERQRRLIRQAHAETAEPAMQQLVLAADQFIVRREQDPAEATELLTAGRTIIAGYHWFNDWGRDTMIALPGLTLATGRAEDASTILRTFARYVAGGLLPNNFPDHAGVVPGYNTVDATLWYVEAIRAYHAVTGDNALVDELLPTIRAIADMHIAGTHYGIGVDSVDGLLRAGEPGLQLTWMDAKVGDYVVTPRIGKPVEINALWHNLLRTLADFLVARGDGTAATYLTLADRVRASFRLRFVSPAQAYLSDVIDGPNGDDWTLRPNQIFAVALHYPLLDGELAKQVVDTVGNTLLTSYGLRSLASADPAYRGGYGGDPYRRDTAYHQGTVWPWLIGAYAEAHHRVYADREAALKLLRPFGEHLRDAGLGSMSEILDGEPPHTPRGAVAQAWSVAEVLRVWRQLAPAAARKEYQQ